MIKNEPKKSTLKRITSREHDKTHWSSNARLHSETNHGYDKNI